MAKNPQISEMRDVVQLAIKNNIDTVDVYGNAQTQTTYTNVGNAVRAKLMPSKAHKSIGKAQLDQTLENSTHDCWIYWQDAVDVFDTVTRQQITPDGTTRTELFRVVGSADNDGQLRFLKMDLQLVSTS